MLGLSIVVVLAILCVVCSEKMEQFTFKGPFEETDVMGQRVIGSNWKTAGTTVVNKNFIRLTPDRQSKKGSVWSKKSLGVPSFSTVLQFRISGQGKTFFGDGIALWITQNSYHVDGIIHGTAENFIGVGVIFDTFKNTENLSAHRDITVLVNNGDKTYEMMTKDVMGCAAKVRYHADRADFSVMDSSRAKVVVQGKSLEVFVDAANTGEWESCVSVPELDLPEFWASRAYIGMTATTGQLADNHDIISLKTYSDQAVLEADEEKEKSVKDTPLVLPVGESLETKINILAESVNKLMGTMEVQDHHVEHQLAAVQDHIKNLIGKIQAREDKSENRIENLEALVKKEVAGSLDSRLTALEMQMKGSVEKKMMNIETSLDRKMTRLQSQADEFGKENAGSWKLPFLILVVLLVAAAVGLYFFYEKMRKMHLL